MKVSVAADISADGHITRHGEPDISAWVSREDHEHFQKLIADHSAIVIGRTVYELMRDSLKLKPGKLRVVLTSQPEKFAGEEVPDQLEFRKMTPAELVESLEKRGHKELLVVGGTRMMTEFLKASLVDIFYLTVEPRFFGSGDRLLLDQDLDIKLQLKEFRQLNDTGTMLLTYEVS